MSSGHGQGLFLALCFEVLVVVTADCHLLDRCHTVWQFITNVLNRKVTPVFREQE